MKISILLLFISFSSFAQNGAKYRYQIQNDTTWSSDTVKVNNDIIVSDAATLFINPGVYVEFQGHYKLEVHGNIIATGTVTDSIMFAINDTTNFADTAVYSGGWAGIRLIGNNTDTSIFSYCRFSSGKAVFPGYSPEFDTIDENNGGVVHAVNYANIKISNSLFKNNWANRSGGAIYAKNCQWLYLSYNIFKENECFFSGGGVEITSCGNFDCNNNLFISNIAYREYLTPIGIVMMGIGSGMAIFSTFSRIYNNEFYNNYSTGGALYESTYNCYINNNIIANNIGGGLMNGHSFGISTYCNNIVVNNLTVLQGPGIVFLSENIKMRNNIIWGNENMYWPPSPIQVYSPEEIIADLKYSCDQDPYPGEGNISDNPKFVNPTAGSGNEYDGLSADWTLMESSPCINTGTPDTTGLGLPATDIAGNPRVFGGRIDMGAYENQSVWVKVNNAPLSNEIRLYPNPGSDKVYIEVPPGVEGAWFDVVDGMGKNLVHMQINFSPAILSPSNLPSGIYFYRIYNQQKVFKTGKWVKRE